MTTRPADYCDTEKQCPRCGEWWPADQEFFHRTGQYLMTYCKACTSVMRRERYLRSKGQRDGLD